MYFSADILIYGNGTLISVLMCSHISVFPSIHLAIMHGKVCVTESYLQTFQSLMFYGSVVDKTKGFRPEWYIMTIYNCRDIPFWWEALKM